MFGLHASRSSLLGVIVVSTILSNTASAQGPVQFEFDVLDAEATFDPSDGEADVEVLFRIDDLTSTPTSGFSFGLAHDPSLLEILGAEPTGPLAAYSGGAGPDFFQADCYPEGITVAVIYSLSGFPLDYASSDDLISFDYETVSSALVGQASPVVTPVELVGTIGTPPVTIVAVYDQGNQTTIPLLDDATVTLTPDGGFLRGDCNSDALFNVADPVSLLNALFVPMTPGPGCPDACDVNDDGGLDIADAIYALSALFIPGAPLPMSPHPNCGGDTTADGLICLSAPCP